MEAERAPLSSFSDKGEDIIETEVSCTMSSAAVRSPGIP